MKNVSKIFLKVIFFAAIEYLRKLIIEFSVVKMDRNSPNCRSLTGVALSGSRGGCCTPTSGRDRWREQLGVDPRKKEGKER